MREADQARAAFMGALRGALRGAPQNLIDDILADFAAHFDEGRAQGRGDDEIAASLGDPVALAGELRIERGVVEWERQRSVPAAARLLARLFGLGALNTTTALFIAPVLAIAAFLAIILVASFFLAGAWLLLAGSSLGLHGGIAATMLAGIGMIAAAATLAALIGLAALGLADVAGAYARMHLASLPPSFRAMRA